MLSEWLQLDQSDPLTYEKEVLYADNFEKRSGDVLEYKFGITPNVLDHLSLSVDEQIKNGVEIPYASKHKGWELAENRWGDVVGARRGRNKQGKDALFLRVKFKDDEAKKLGLRANVSVGVPPISYDGLGRKYTNPLRHLAATSAPVIPGLSEWSAIAASFESDEFVPIIGDLAMPPFPPKKDQNNQDQGGQGDQNQGSQNQNDKGGQNDQKQGDQSKQQPSGSQGQQQTNIYDQILQVLELQVPPDANDMAKGTAILTALQMLKGKRQMAQQQQQQQGQQQFGKQQQQAQPGGGIQLSQEKVSPLILDTISKNRELQLSQLVTSGILDPNCAKEIQNMYGSREAIGIELSQGGDGEQFNKLIEVLSKNKPTKQSGRSAANGLPDDEIQLGHDGQSGLQAAVDKRRQAAGMECSQSADCPHKKK